MKSKPDKMPNIAIGLNMLARILLATFTLAVIIAIALRLALTDGSIILADIQQYTFGSLMLTAILIAFQNNKHVKAGLIDNKLTESQRRYFSVAWIFIFAIIPSALIMALSVSDVIIAWQHLEGSREHGGLPGYFLVKSLLPVFCLMMIIIGAGKILSFFGATGN